MFVMMADIRLKEGAEADFARWFSESNKALAGCEGFVSRRLLKGNDGGYRIMVEHESKETFVKMHNSPEHENLHPAGHSFMEGEPQRRTFTVVVG